MQLGARIEHHAQQSPQALALHFEGDDVTYAEFWRRVLQAQAALQQRGIATGDRVAWLGQNDPAMLVLLFALARLDAILVPLNYRLAEPELAAILQDAGARLLVLNAAGLANAPGPPPGLSCMPATELAAPVQIATRSGAGLNDAPVLLVYTSGTTGKAKGALYRQSALLANCRIAAHAQEMHRTDRVLTVLPLFHVGGLCIQTLPALHLGAQVHLQRSFEAGAWLCAVHSRRPTLSLMVPATLRAVLDHSSFAATDFSSLRLLMTGSSVVPLALIEQLHARGVPVGQVYGATETGPVSICLVRAQAMLRPGSAGQAARDVEVRLLGTSGQPIAVSEVGEVG
ncbi:MAG: AMP-binding protein, partial [Rhodoferax sp.]|nr:AMP-binding protein [Rhodoferax sp.]